MQKGQCVVESRWALLWLYPICYYVELLLYNAAPVARIIVLCLQGYWGLMDLGFYLRWWLIKFFQRWEGELISYISWCTFFFEIVLCLSRRTVYVAFENMERLGSLSCVRGGDYLRCSFATIVRTSACEVDDLWRRCVQRSIFRVSTSGDLARQLTRKILRCTTSPKIIHLTRRRPYNRCNAAS